MRREEEEARVRAKKQEEKRKRKEQRMAVVTELKTVAVQRRGEAQRLLQTLLAGAAEDRLPLAYSPPLSLTQYTTFKLAILCGLAINSHFRPFLSAIRYQQEEAEKRIRLDQQHKEDMERRRLERVAEEVTLRDKLIRNVQQLEQRRKEVQRELVLRDISQTAGSSQQGRPSSNIPSAVVIPHHHQ